jgi:hypothetical protein
MSGFFPAIPLLRRMRIPRFVLLAFLTLLLALFPACRTALHHSAEGDDPPEQYRPRRCRLDASLRRSAETA